MKCRISIKLRNKLNQVAFFEIAFAHPNEHVIVTKSGNL